MKTVSSSCKCLPASTCTSCNGRGCYAGQGLSRHLATLQAATSAAPPGRSTTVDRSSLCASWTRWKGTRRTGSADSMHPRKRSKYAWRRSSLKHKALARRTWRSSKGWCFWWRAVLEGAHTMRLTSMSEPSGRWSTSLLQTSARWDRWRTCHFWSCGASLMGIGDLKPGASDFRTSMAS